MCTRMIVGVVGLFVFAQVGGCSLTGELFKSQADKNSAVALDLAQRMADGSQSQFTMSAQGINPRYVGGLTITYEAYVGIDGVYGGMTSSASGPLSDREMPAAIEAIARNEELSAAQRMLLLRDLINRAEPPTKLTPVATKPEPAPTPVPD